MATKSIVAAKRCLVLLLAAWISRREDTAYIARPSRTRRARSRSDSVGPVEVVQLLAPRTVGLKERNSAPKFHLAVAQSFSARGSLLIIGALKVDRDHHAAAFVQNVGAIQRHCSARRRTNIVKSFSPARGNSLSLLVSLSGYLVANTCCC